MVEPWTALPLDRPYFANLDPDAVVGQMTAVENGYQNELGGMSRFPGMVERVNLGGKDRVYLSDFNGDLMAVTSKGQVYRIDKSYTAVNVTGVPVSGGRRVVFAVTDRELLMAAGGPIIRLRDATTELLSTAAPLATHIGWIDNFTIAVEIDSGRFFHSSPGSPDQWDPLDTFAADGSPDNINSLLITPFRELLLAGEKSVEQFERVTSGDPPFFRRWAVGDGVKLPYAVLFADNAMWTINSMTEFVRFSGQTSQAASDTIGRLLEAIDDWTDAWLGGYPDSPCHIVGQKFMILQAPNATNEYGTKGVTIGFDYRGKRFFQLYGWDASLGLPRRWLGWSHWRLWDKVFVGGEGKIYELTASTYRNGDELQRWLIRTAHLGEGNAMQVRGLRLRLRRGTGILAAAPKVRVRCSRNGRPFGSWITRTLGNAGDRVQYLEYGAFGNGMSHQFEISCTDNAAVDLLKAEIKVEELGH